MHIFSVLIVDDEADFLETVVKRLEQRKINVTGVRSGEEALEQLKKHDFSVIILDVKMPGGMDGIEALRKIKKICFYFCICGIFYNTRLVNMAYEVK